MRRDFFIYKKHERGHVRETEVLGKAKGAVMKGGRESMQLCILNRTS